ncbi:hypothetical protein KIPB_003465 [Kipferlia bialata]|uniref:Uncharacterized protein n=1 Tax=Kipferlia bialata TaxID=797122 RepID=A0A391NKN1_9EUKA|nr:hypothetical protein KIPB_003465 [Kipferlia bialata]|eukprot:g3465.t1
MREVIKEVLLLRDPLDPRGVCDVYSGFTLPEVMECDEEGQPSCPDYEVDIHMNTRVQDLSVQIQSLFKGSHPQRVLVFTCPPKQKGSLDTERADATARDCQAQWLRDRHSISVESLSQQLLPGTELLSVDIGTHSTVDMIFAAWNSLHSTLPPLGCDTQYLIVLPSSASLDISEGQIPEAIMELSLRFPVSCGSHTGTSQSLLDCVQTKLYSSRIVCVFHRVGDLFRPVIGVTRLQGSYYLLPSHMTPLVLGNTQCTWQRLRDITQPQTLADMEGERFYTLNVEDKGMADMPAELEPLSQEQCVTAVEGMGHTWIDREWQPAKRHVVVVGPQAECLHSLGVSLVARRERFGSRQYDLAAIIYDDSVVSRDVGDSNPFLPLHFLKEGEVLRPAAPRSVTQVVGYSSSDELRAVLSRCYTLFGECVVLTYGFGGPMLMSDVHSEVVLRQRPSLQQLKSLPSHCPVFSSQIDPSSTREVLIERAFADHRIQIQRPPHGFGMNYSDSYRLVECLRDGTRDTGMLSGFIGSIKRFKAAEKSGRRIECTLGDMKLERLVGSLMTDSYLVGVITDGMYIKTMTEEDRHAIQESMHKIWKESKLYGPQKCVVLLCHSQPLPVSQIPHGLSFLRVQRQYGKRIPIVERDDDDMTLRSISVILSSTKHLLDRDVDALNQSMRVPLDPCPLSDAIRVSMASPGEDVATLESALAMVRWNQEVRESLVPLAQAAWCRILLGPRGVLTPSECTELLRELPLWTGDVDTSLLRLDPAGFVCNTLVIKDYSYAALVLQAIQQCAMPEYSCAYEPVAHYVNGDPLLTYTQTLEAVFSQPGLWCSISTGSIPPSIVTDILSIPDIDGNQLALSMLHAINKMPVMSTPLMQSVKHLEISVRGQDSDEYPSPQDWVTQLEFVTAKLQCLPRMQASLCGVDKSYSYQCLKLILHTLEESDTYNETIGSLYELKGHMETHLNMLIQTSVAGAGMALDIVRILQYRLAECDSHHIRPWWLFKVFALSWRVSALMSYRGHSVYHGFAMAVPHAVPYRTSGEVFLSTVDPYGTLSFDAIPSILRSLSDSDVSHLGIVRAAVSPLSLGLRIYALGMDDQKCICESLAVVNTTTIQGALSSNLSSKFYHHPMSWEWTPDGLRAMDLVHEGRYGEWLLETVLYRRRKSSYQGCGVCCYANTEVDSHNILVDCQVVRDEEYSMESSRPTFYALLADTAEYYYTDPLVRLLNGSGARCAVILMPGIPIPVALLMDDFEED